MQPHLRHRQAPSVLGRPWSGAPHAHCSSDNTSAFITLGEGFPDGISGKDHTSQCRRHKRHGLDPWVRKMPWRRAWQPTPVLLPRESHGLRSLARTTVHGVSKNQTWLKRHYPGEVDLCRSGKRRRYAGSSGPLRAFCENPYSTVLAKRTHFPHKAI